MKGSQGNLFGRELALVSDEVFQAIADELGYGNRGVDTGLVASWVAAGNCPVSVLETAGDRLAHLMGLDEDCTLLELSEEGESVWAAGDGGEVRYSVADILEVWRRNQSRGRGGDEFPLSPVIRSYFEEPRLVKPDSRSTGRIMPAKLAMVAQGDSRGGGVFSWAAHARGSGKEQLIMPGFEREDTVGPVLPLMLYDLGGSDDVGGRHFGGAVGGSEGRWSAGHECAVAVGAGLVVPGFQAAAAFGVLAETHAGRGDFG